MCHMYSKDTSTVIVRKLLKDTSSVIVRKLLQDTSSVIIRKLTGNCILNSALSCYSTEGRKYANFLEN